MTRQDILMIRLTEESAEVVQAVSKLINFGPDGKVPDKNMTNREHLIQELNDLMAVAEMSLGVPLTDIINLDMMQAKKDKVEYFIGYSRQLGIVQD